jgi:NAD(P)H-dependent flavin oxidoreductase YrpB (nitropropane dioxygenase family)
MRTAMNDLLDFDVPFFAFSHCRDVVAAVTNAGGVGVLGAVAHTADDLEVDMKWVENEIAAGATYGVDLLMPSKFAGVKQGGLSREDLRAQIPEGHRAFMEDLLDRYGIPPLLEVPREQRVKRAGLQVDPKSMTPLLDIAFAHDIKLIVSGLGSPPPEVIERAHAAGVVVGAQAGTVEHAVRHKEAGVDFVIAQGTEAGGHTGDITTMVLVPQVVDAVAPLPVLAAGGIANGRQAAASLALGAAGVWCGSIWLGTEEGESTPAERDRFVAARSQDTTRSRSFTGKPCRVLKSAWTEAWEQDGAPEPLPMPLQSMLVDRSRRRVQRVAHKPDSRAPELLSPFIGQIVGQIKTIKPTRRVMAEMMEEMAEAIDRLHTMVSDD